MPHRGAIGGLTHLTDYLWLSGTPSTEAVVHHRFTLVLTICGRKPLLPLGVTGRQIPIDDLVSVHIYPHFHTAADWIEQERLRGGRILVHCQMGVSRSVSIVLAYLMIYPRHTLWSAYHLVSQKRPQVYPNVGFCRDLLRLELQLFGSNSIRLDQLHPPQ